MRFNVLIATYNRCPMLARTLSSLQAARRPAGFERVLVIENGPQMGAEDICREASRNGLPVEYHHIAAAGKGRAIQHGLELIKDGFVLFLDDDVRVSPELLEIYAEAARAYKADKIYGGPLLVDCDQPPPDWLLPHLPPSAKGWQNDPQESYRFFLGANFGAFVERIMSVGGFNQALGPGAVRPGTAANPTGIETDLQRRLMESGCEQMYLPEAKVWHYVPGSACTPRWALHRHYRNSITKAMKPGRFVEGVCWFGVPRYIWHSFCVSSLSALASFMTSDEEKRFAMRRDFYEYRGYIRGLRLRRRGYTVEKKA